jgi:putative transposase
VDIRKWICPNCHSELDRDENAAINIENEGLRILEIA